MRYDTSSRSPVHSRRSAGQRATPEGTTTLPTWNTPPSRPYTTSPWNRSWSRYTSSSARSQLGRGRRNARPALNVAPKRALLADSNPHLIRFYRAIDDGTIDGPKARRFLKREGQLLADRGQDHYYHVRDRFNSIGDPLDFLFLNRSCFNGLIRFNKKGNFNVPFGHKPERFAQAYVTKIVNQIECFRAATEVFDWRFECQDYQVTIAEAKQSDFVYCDPPYIGRHVDYFDSWDAQSERSLYDVLKSTDVRFMLSTWHSNEHRENVYLRKIWRGLEVSTTEHFYHVGAQEKNRRPMLEALVTNYVRVGRNTEYGTPEEQLMLFERSSSYLAEDVRSTV